MWISGLIYGLSTIQMYANSLPSQMFKVREDFRLIKVLSRFHHLTGNFPFSIFDTCGREILRSVKQFPFKRFSRVFTVKYLWHEYEAPCYSGVQFDFFLITHFPGGSFPERHANFAKKVQQEIHQKSKILEK